MQNRLIQRRLWIVAGRHHKLGVGSVTDKRMGDVGVNRRTNLGSKKDWRAADLAESADP